MYQQQFIQTPKAQVFVWGLNENFLFPQDPNKKSISVPSSVKINSQSGFIQCSSGNFSNFVLNADGEVFVWGINKNGRLGSGDQDLCKIPTKISLEFRVIQISCGSWHALLLSDKGQPWSSGHNQQGALGIGTTQESNTFQPINLQDIVQIAAGYGYSLFLTINGQIFSCGHFKRNGLGLKQNTTSPKQILLDQTFSKVAAGFLHAGAISQQGTLFTWGDGSCYQLGHGDQKDKDRPMEINNQLLRNVKQISFSRGEKYNHSGAVDDEGNAYTWGSGYKGKLGHSDEWSHKENADEPYPKLIASMAQKVLEIQCGGIHTSIIDKDRNIWTFGCGSDGRLGHPESEQHTYLYKESQPRMIPNLKAISFSSSYYHNIAISN